MATLAEVTPFAVPAQAPAVTETITQAELTGIDPTEQIVSRVRTAERLLGRGDKR